MSGARTGGMGETSRQPSFASPILSRLVGEGKRYYALLALLAVFAILPLVFGGAYEISLLFSVVLAMAMAQSWNISGGYSGQLSFGHFGFLGVGAYVFAILAVTFNWSVAAALLASAAFTFVTGYVVGFFGAGLRGAYFAVATLAAAALMQLTVNNWDSLTNGSKGFPLFYLVLDSSVIYYATLVLVAVACLLVIWISRSRVGLAFEAIRENEDVAIASGVNTRNFKAFALALSAAIMGPAGGFYALFFLYIDPSATSVFSIIINLQLIVMVIVGGRGTVLGPILGAILFGAFFYVIQTMFSTVQYAVTGVAIFLLVLLLPRGLLGIRGVPKAVRF